MSVFLAAGHLCCWARRSPQVRSSAGRRTGSSAAGNGNPCLGAALGEAAAAVGRTQTFLATKCRRLVRYMPEKKAQGAVGRTRLVITYEFLSGPGNEYTDLGTNVPGSAAKWAVTPGS